MTDATTTDKQFRVLMTGMKTEQKARCPKTIPWAIVEPHQAQAKRNHSQTLERLNERGGCSPAEIYFIVNDMPWRDGSKSDAAMIDWLVGVVEAHAKASVAIATTADAKRLEEIRKQVSTCNCLECEQMRWLLAIIDRQNAVMEAARRLSGISAMEPRMKYEPGYTEWQIELDTAVSAVENAVAALEEPTP